MRSKRLLKAAVAALTMLVGGLGMALWPSPADAGYSIRKFAGPHTGVRWSASIVELHNPHPTATVRWEIVTRYRDGTVQSRLTGTIGPNRFISETPTCEECSVEVNTNHALLQPSMKYFSVVTNTWEFIYPGDFSR